MGAVCPPAQQTGWRREQATAGLHRCERRSARLPRPLPLLWWIHADHPPLLAALLPAGPPLPHALRRRARPQGGGGAERREQRAGPLLGGVSWRLPTAGHERAGRRHLGVQAPAHLLVCCNTHQHFRTCLRCSDLRSMYLVALGEGGIKASAVRPGCSSCSAAPQRRATATARDGCSAQASRPSTWARLPPPALPCSPASRHWGPISLMRQEAAPACALPLQWPACCLRRPHAASLVSLLLPLPLLLMVNAPTPRRRLCAAPHPSRRWSERRCGWRRRAAATAGW